MKRYIYILVFAIFSCLVIIAQEENSFRKGAFLFDEFTDECALLKNKLFTYDKFNYDCVRQALHFMDHSSNIDTILYPEPQIYTLSNPFSEMYSSWQRSTS